MANIAIITARGGSKRIPLKNIRLFHGIPIIAYSIKAALNSGLFDEVMVSTDSEEIAIIAKTYGASVPFFRSEKNSDDYASTAVVLEEVLLNYQSIGKNFSFACCIYPTAPFVTSEKLNLAYETILREKADVVIPIIKYSSSIWRSFNLQEDSRIKYNWPEHKLTRSQDLKNSYYDCGQFYFFSVEIFLKSLSLVTENTIGIEMPGMEVQDIDTEEDWKLAEIKYSINNNNSNNKV